MFRALLAGLASIAVACAGPASAPGAAPRLSPEERARLEAELAPFAPAFAGLEAALDERDDELARRILARIHAREPRGAALERARAYERILEGREWIATLSIRLEAERVGETDEWRLRAVASHSGRAGLTLRGAPPTLRVSLLGVSKEGLEQRVAQTAQVPELAEWHLPAGIATEAELGTFPVARGTALAVRMAFALEFLPGEVVREEAVRPATRVPVGRTEVLRLAPELSPEPVEPAELARYVRDEKLRTLPLLERTVRIAPERRSEALDLLTDALLELPPGELERMSIALRWLSGRADLGADARTWRQWLAERTREREKDAERARSGSPALELPDEHP